MRLCGRCWNQVISCGSVAELKSRYAQKAAGLEQALHQRLRQQQKVYEEAFKQDMKLYLSTGHLQHRGEWQTEP